MRLQNLIDGQPWGESLCVHSEAWWRNAVRGFHRRLPRGMTEEHASADLMGLRA